MKTTRTTDRTSMAPATMVVDLETALKSLSLAKVLEMARRLA